MLCKALVIYSKGSGDPEDALQQQSDMMKCIRKISLVSVYKAGGQGQIQETPAIV